MAFTDVQIEAIIDSHFRGKHENPHTALSEALGIPRDEAKLLFYKYVYSDKWLKRVMVEPHQEIWKAVHRLHKAKGRYHTELATRNLFLIAGVEKEPDVL